MIRKRQISPVDLIQAVLDRIAQIDSRVGAFITVTGVQAMDAARLAEREIQQGKYRGPLHGIPVGLKDTNYTQGIPTTAATPVLKDFIPTFDATIVRRLKEAGAIIIGKTRLPEFSFGGATPGTNNPWDLSRNAGGSSGGSGAALAASMILGATGGDTSGSIINPANVCGVVGLKPTFGLVSRYGVVAISWTLDHIGPMARTVEDTAILLKVLAGYDPNDSFSAQVPVPDYPALLKRNVRGLRLGIPPAAFIEGLHADTRNAFLAALKVLEGLGVRMQEVAVPPSLRVAASTHGIIRICEAAAYHRQFLLTKADQYDREEESRQPVARVRTTVEAGSLLTAAQYLRAQQIRRVFLRQMFQLFEPLDAVVMPTSNAPAGERANNPPPFLSWNNFNLCGFPSISVPAGFSTGPLPLPIGIHIAARPFQDALVLALAHAYESATNWHTHKPQI